MKRYLVTVAALLLAGHAFASQQCVEVGQMYFSAATQRDQAVPQEAVTRNIRKNFGNLSKGYNLDLVVSAAFKHFDISPEMLQDLASAKCEDDKATRSAAKP